METVDSAAQSLERPVSTPVTVVSWNECYGAARLLWQRIKESGAPYIYGIPRGGSMAAALVQNFAVKDGQRLYLADKPIPGQTYVVDDLVDSGATLSKWALDGSYIVDALFRKPCSPKHIAPNAVERGGWLTFPWEAAEGTGAEDLVVRLLQYIGEDTTRDGLRDTPKRVLKAWKELTAGYGQDPKTILSRTFEETSDELVMVRGVEFHSTCEHHLLPFYGTASVGYIPFKRVVGLSKMARLVDCYARRLQVQERMTSQIARAMMEHLQPLGVGVVVTARHSCMGCRGVMKPDADMVTSAMLGALREEGRARAEFLSLVGLRRG